MYKITVIIVAVIALTAHTTGSIAVQVVKIGIDDLLSMLLVAGRNGERHKIPYHNENSFGLHSRYGYGNNYS